MNELTGNTTVWPHPEELLYSGSKVQGYKTIAMASMALGFSSPMYATHSGDPNDVAFLEVLATGTMKGVLKREYSMRGDHVITSATPNAKKVFQDALKAQEETWGEVKYFFGEPIWFVQPRIEPLILCGK
jgi:hypothetical protein